MLKTGFVAIVGRPNVGKSTLLNKILGNKVSITSHKAQTTRQKIIGIKTDKQIQTIYVDTPGLHRQANTALNKFLNKTASQAVRDVDLVIFVIEALRWTDEDCSVLGLLQQQAGPIVLVINKVDKIKNKDELLPFITQLTQKANFAAIIPLAAATGNNIVQLEIVVTSYLADSEFFYYPKDRVTDRTDRFLAAEIIREKLMRLLRDELPYSTAVSIELFEEPAEITKCLAIHAIIWVERVGQKAIVLGKYGLQIKEIGIQARIDMERLFKQKIFLKLWVKVRDSWSNDERALRSLGYDDEF